MHGNLFSMKEVKIERDKAIITRLEDGIIKVEVRDNIEFNEADLDDNYRIYLDIKTQERVPFLVIFGLNSFAQSATRLKFADKKRARIKLKEALVLTSLAHRLIAQFYINYHKPNHPTKIFSNERDALIWLREN